MKPTRAALYTRGSTASQNHHFEALAFDQRPEPQEESLRRPAEHYGWIIALVYADWIARCKSIWLRRALFLLEHVETWSGLGRCRARNNLLPTGEVWTIFAHMIRFRRLTLGHLNAWLVDQRVQSAHARYRLRVWRENRAGLAAIRRELIDYIDEAFEDARRRIRRGFEDDLSPFRDTPIDPAANYPSLLHRVTLQGYFGETLAVIAVEHWGAHGHMDWAVPAFLFRMHEVEFQHLDRISEHLTDCQEYDRDADGERRPGRTGDDGLAFRINGENVITDVLTLEAKCLAKNSNAKIEDAHRKLVTGGRRPPGVRELVSLLAEYNTPEAQVWQHALLKLWSEGYQVATRHDGVAYVCGRVPARTGSIAWMPVNAPHPAYTVARKLEGLEFQIEDLARLINTLYRGA
jgi:hypothetical protein